ncbi:MAG: A24 family peptidase [Oscillospiraceae bacterium]|nr:A24 family peptidase [Oscillospiraceae bacterium]
MTKYLPILITDVVLIYGGAVDFRKREIPDLVPLALLIVGGIFAFSLFWSIISLVVPAILLFAAAKITKNEIPGGDFKLLCSLGFACGLRQLTAIILFVGIGALIYGFIKHLPVKRHIPLCSYIAPAYIALQILMFAMA